MRTVSPRSHTLAISPCVTENIGNLGTLRRPSLLKAWHVHGYMLHHSHRVYPTFLDVRLGQTSGWVALEPASTQEEWTRSS
jgi:hypothetical protein